MVEKPEGRKIINSKWVFKIKRDENGNITLYKARLVAKGCAQKRGYDYDETYVPVARLATLRILLSTIVENDLFASQLDVESAFLHGDLHETIYMKVPPGIVAKDSQVCKLTKNVVWSQAGTTRMEFHFDSR